MKTTMLKYSILVLCAGVCGQTIWAQEYNKALTYQGVEQTTNTSAASRGMGGTTIAVKNDVGMMFANPASLQSIEGIQISVGAYRQFRTIDQSQMWFPSASYPNFSLLMGGLTDTLTLPVIDSATYAAYFAVSTNNPSGADTIFRQYDNIRSGWRKEKNKNQPVQIFAAIPFVLSDIKLAVGIGCVEYANLDYIYQNNNVLTPDPGKLYPQPFLRPLTDDNSAIVPILWSQSQRTREGSIYGYGGAFSADVGSNISVGVSAMYLMGSADDNETIVGRGMLAMHRTFFSMRKDIYASYQKGVSDFKGQEFTGSGVYGGKHLTIGFAIKPPTSITRDYSGTLIVQNRDTTVTSSALSVSDKLKLPWRGSVGLGIAFRQNMSVKLEYEYLPLSGAVLTKSDSTSNPWLNSYRLKVGFEYNPVTWLAIRCGYNRRAEVFATQNYYFPTDPLSSESYSAGIGMRFYGIQADLAYEYARISYEDMWTTNVNMNSDNRQSIVLSLTYVLNE